MRPRILALVLAAVITCPFAAHADGRAVRLKWQDAASLARGRTAIVTTTGGAKRKGRIANFTPEAILFEDSKKGTVPRPDVAEIRVVDYVGNGRHVGKMLGGAAGLLAGLLTAAVVGLDEAAGNQDRNKAIAVVSVVGGLPAGMIGGYLLGRRLDKQVTIVRILPEP